MGFLHRAISFDEGTSLNMVFPEDLDQGIAKGLEVGPGRIEVLGLRQSLGLLPEIAREGLVFLGRFTEGGCSGGNAIKRIFRQSVMNLEIRRHDRLDGCGNARISGVNERGDGEKHHT